MRKDHHLESEDMAAIDDHFDVNPKSESPVASSLAPEMPTHPRLKQIHRKVDWRLCTVLGFIYTISIIDRVNIANANVAGMVKELNFKHGDYHDSPLLVVIFFPFYIVFQPPMTVIGRKIGPRTFLPFIVLVWGVVIICFGFVNSLKAMLPLRCILGILEAGYFPSAVYLMSSWYTKTEVGKRNAGFYLTGQLFGGFGGILAYGISQMDGVAGKSGWRWIFIIEGIATCVIAVIAYFLIVDFPDKAMDSWKFLEADELKVMVDRLEFDRREDTKLPPFELAPYLRSALDWKIWFFSANFMFASVIAYSASYFFPILFQSKLGFSVAKAQCLSTPCYVFSVILGYGMSYWSDKIDLRYPFLLGGSAMMAIGVCLTGFVDHAGVMYFGTFLIIGGSNMNVPLCLTYQAVNIQGHWKRAFASATIVCGSALGGVVGSLVFRSQDAPGYQPGLVCCLVASVLSFVSVAITTIIFTIKNRQQAQGKLVIEGIEGFRYSL